MRPGTEREWAEVQRWDRLASKIANSFVTEDGPSFEYIKSIAIEGLLKAVQTYSPSKNDQFPNYAWGVVTNYIIDSFRRNQFAEREQVSEAPDQIILDNQSSLEYTEEGELRSIRRKRVDTPTQIGTSNGLEESSFEGAVLDRAVLSKALSSLTDVEQLIVYKSYFQDKTTREIAYDLRWSKSHVANILNRALAKLRECVGERER